ncbi:MAG: bifunctional 23S rRNA (guanine(2069)-N(7))-methyltransferase RlmK/23S rRNA (guanine(2445)-N(2))-methyltransferase RlmL [Methylococcaceae bacterium]|nr:bifunctional 23S rRNA (guanine(2069)-N(7))-methyltransferase RlmK/23S rRNA (guanine(2445)-N(2))-methyltransferase RlmL [Methylococcaceae bacterium]
MADLQFHYFCPAPLGLEALLVEELRQLGIDDVREARAGAGFSGSIEQAYRACLWSRLANRVLLKLAEFPGPDGDALYRGVAALDWAEHLAPDGTLAVDFAASRSRMTHTQFGAQRVKDAIVDQFRELCGVRPSVRLDRPDVRVNVYLDRDVASVSLDLSGESLHKRGYRLEGGAAPLKENLAAALLLRAGWPEVAAAGGEFIDPLCGSGTLPIEAAWMAADVAPGLDRQYFGFLGWKNHDRELWERLLEEAGRRRERGLAGLRCAIAGYDRDRRAIHAALENLDRAGLRGVVHIERRELSAARPRKERGLLVANPPYGERLGEASELPALYAELGGVLRQQFLGWKASVFTGNPELAFRLGIRARRFYRLYNGALECKLFNFEVEPERFFTPHEDETGLSEEARALRKLMRRAQVLAQKPPSAGAEMFANRLRKNLKNLGRWARQNRIDCYRLYDADLPEYAVAVDVYQGDITWLQVQEYEAPASVDPAKAENRLIEALSVLPAVLEIPFEQIFLKVRRRQKGDAQYDKQAEAGRFHAVSEGDCRFWVNFEDYLDTGLFLDHRPTRLMIGKQAQGKHFLNLFGYTGAATVHAAVGGAASTATVDMSRTYLDWARRNLELNGIKGYDHELIQADCLVWLEQAAASGGRKYDLIFLDPPTFSNSKRMAGAFDVVRDHPGLIRNAVQLLAPEGHLIFSTNARKFRLDQDALADLVVEDISASTVPKDFERNPKIHRCWIVHR